MDTMLEKFSTKNGRPKAGEMSPRLAHILEVCDEENLDPFREMAKLAKGAKEEGVRASMCKELASYIAPKRKPVGSAQDDDSPSKISVTRFTTDPKTGAVVKEVAEIEN